MTSSEDISGRKIDVCLSNAILKTGMGIGVGVLTSVFLLRRRAFPVWLGSGFGLGSAYTDCQITFNPALVPVTIASDDTTPKSPS